MYVHVCMYVGMCQLHLHAGRSICDTINIKCHACMYLRSCKSACGSETSFMGKMMLRVICGLDSLEHQACNSQVLIKLMADG